jgi:hypothetical protein
MAMAASGFGQHNKKAPNPKQQYRIKFLIWIMYQVAGLSPLLLQGRQALPLDFTQSILAHSGVLCLSEI